MQNISEVKAILITTLQQQFLKCKLSFFPAERFLLSTYTVYENPLVKLFFYYSSVPSTKVAMKHISM